MPFWHYLGHQETMCRTDRHADKALYTKVLFKRETKGQGLVLRSEERGTK